MTCETPLFAMNDPPREIIGPAKFGRNTAPRFCYQHEPISHGDSPADSTACCFTGGSRARSLVEDPSPLHCLVGADERGERFIGVGEFPFSGGRIERNEGLAN